MLFAGFYKKFYNTTLSNRHYGNTHTRDWDIMMPPSQPTQTYTAEDIAKAREEGIAEGYQRAIDQMRGMLTRMKPNHHPHIKLEQDLAKTIAAAGFCVRAQHALEGVAETVRDLVRMQPSDVEKLPGMGAATFKNVNAILVALDLHLGMNI